MTHEIRGGPECIDIILDVVCNYYFIPKEIIVLNTRKREIILPRQIAMALSRKYTKASLSKIGITIGGKDHATVLHAEKTIFNLVETDKIFRREYNEIDKMVETAIENSISGPIVYVCSNCGSADIRDLYWLNVNSMKIIEKAISDEPSTVCLSCKSKTKAITRQKFIEKLESKYDIKEHTLETVPAGMQKED